jgi:hypothetical protein
MITKQTIIDQTEITRDGMIQIRFGLLLVEDGNVIDTKWHRTSIPPGTDVDAQIAAVNTHLLSLGKMEADAAGISRLKTLVQTVHTPEVVAAYRAKMNAQAVPVKI